MNELFSYGPPGINSYSIHDEFPVKKSFFENYGVISLEQVQSLADSMYTATGNDANRVRYKDECWYIFLFNSVDHETQKYISQTVKTHYRRGIVAHKIATAKVTQADAEVVRLAKKELQQTHLKDFNYDISKAVERVREIVATLEANDVISGDHIDDIIAVFKDKTTCEDFRLHLKMFEMEKLKGRMIDIEAMLTELNSKFTSLAKQNEWINSKSTSNIDSKYMAISASTNTSSDIM